MLVSPSCQNGAGNVRKTAPVHKTFFILLQPHIYAGCFFFLFLPWEGASLSALHFVPHRSPFLNLPKEFTGLCFSARGAGEVTRIWDTHRQKVLFYVVLYSQPNLFLVPHSTSLQLSYLEHFAYCTYCKIPHSSGANGTKLPSSQGSCACKVTLLVCWGSSGSRPSSWTYGHLSQIRVQVLMTKKHCMQPCLLLGWNLCQVTLGFGGFFWSWQNFLWWKRQYL